MADLVGTCPKDFWEEWIREGDAAGDPETGQDWSWYTNDSTALRAKPGDRFYIVAHGKLRGFAPVIRVENPPLDGDTRYAIIRRGGAVACTLPIPIQGFRGLRLRWWRREEEQLFENRSERARWRNAV